jgi:hypothetical protein
LDDYGLKSIDWNKPRGAGYMSNLEESEHVIKPSKIIRTIRRATRFYREICKENNKENLFLHHNSTRGSSKINKADKVLPMVPSSTTILNEVKIIIHKASGGKWQGTSKMIRNSLLLYKGLTGGLIAIQKAAQHESPRTSQIYANKAPMLAQHDQKMLEFREWLETLVTIGLDDVASKLGVNEKFYSKIKKEILGSRFGGLYCKDPLAGFQLEMKKGEVCTKFSSCLTCEGRRNIFIATLDNILHLLHWKESLEEARKKGLIDYNVDQGWYLWFLFIDEMLERLKNGGLRYNALLVDARKVSKQRINPYMKINFNRE